MELSLYMCVCIYTAKIKACIKYTKIIVTEFWLLLCVLHKKTHTHTDIYTYYTYVCIYIYNIYT